MQDNDVKALSEVRLIHAEECLDTTKRYLLSEIIKAPQTVLIMRYSML